MLPPDRAAAGGGLAGRVEQLERESGVLRARIEEMEGKGKPEPKVQ